MTNQLVLEVIDGPMDGLNCLIDKTGKIGRSVGNMLSLALDLEISGRHAELSIEGPSWVLRDLNSTNGTWFKGQKLSPGTSYPLRFNDVFLVGSTLIQAFQGSILDVIGSIKDSDFKDPRKEYQLSPDLVSIWNELYASVGKEGGFCNVSTLFLELALLFNDNAKNIYDSVGKLLSASRYGLLDSWLAKAAFNPYLQMIPETLIIAPRVRRVMEIAAKKSKGPIEAIDIVKAIMEEGRSLASIYLAKDTNLLQDFGIISGATADRISSTNGGISPSYTPPETAESPARETDAKAPLSAKKIEPYCDFALNIEKILKGFLEDAVAPVSGTKKVSLPGLEKDLSQLTGEQDIQQYLETLYHLLVLILASQREGYMIYGKKLCSRMSKAIANSADPSSNILSLGKKSPTVQDISNIVRATLTKTESEGLSEQVIRNSIKNKVKKYIADSKPH